MQTVKNLIFFVSISSVFRGYFNGIQKFSATAKSQSIEQFIKTNKKKYGVIIFVLGILIANFHAATWPLMFVLFMPYIASGIITEFSCEKIYIMLKKHSEKKLKKVPENSDKYIKISEDIDIYNKIIKKYAEKKSYKIVKRKNYNLRNLILLMLIVIISGFITPIHDVPFTYIIKSMFGYSNFKSGKSMIHISEMQPIIPASSVSFLVFMVVLVEFLLNGLDESLSSNALLLPSLSKS